MTPERLMTRAIALSKRGYPAPNPHVGCVIARNGEIVGEGWHEYAGGPHAEIVALGAAAERAKGADVYVTLEPCDHQGRTSPCSQALIQAGVRSVSVAIEDPNPLAKGGLERLRLSGIDVRSGFLADEARKANEMWLTAMERRSPYVVGKAAMSMDGRVALPSGESKWITSDAARKQAHKLRAECGAVLVGRGTVKADDPLLTARIPGVRNQPVRLVLDPGRGLTGREQVFNADAETWWLVAEPQSSRELPLRVEHGVVDLRALLQSLHQKGVTSLLVEGGPKTLSSFLAEGCIDRVELFVAPIVLGAGPTWFEGDVARLEEALRMNFDRAKKLGPDLWITGRPSKR